MKKTTLVGCLIFVVTFVVGVVVALQQGTKEDLFVHAQLHLSDQVKSRAKPHRTLYVILYDLELSLIHI